MSIEVSTSKPILDTLYQCPKANPASVKEGQIETLSPNP